MHVLCYFVHLPLENGQYMQLGNKFLPLLVGGLLFASMVQAQDQLQGQVWDADTDIPLSGASVRFAGDQRGTITDERGLFILPVLGDSLIISYTGYRSDTLFEPNTQSFYRVYLRAGTQLPEYTLRAQPTLIDINRAASLQRIDRQQIRQTDQLNPAPLLNQVPGVFMQTGALNTNRITIRGVGNRIPFGTAKIRAYLDDIPLTNGVGETVLEDIDLSIIDRIDIRRGPTASSYGAGLGGLIRYRTGPKQDSHTGFSLEQQAGSYGTQRTVAEAHLSAADAPLHLNLNLNHTHSDGYRGNNTYDRTGFTALARYGQNERDQATTFINYNDVRAFIPSSLNETDFRNNPTRAAFTWAEVNGFEDYEQLVAGVNHRRDWLADHPGAALTSSVSLFGTVRNNYEVRPFNILRENNRALGFRQTWTYRSGKQQALPLAEVGLEYYSEQYDWTTNETLDGGQLGELRSDQLENRRYYNLFGEINWQPGPSWLLTAGLNLNRTRYTLTDRYPTDPVDRSGRYQFAPVWSPRLNLAYRLRPRINLFATLSHGFSPPTLEETLNPDGTRNPDIQPERGWNVEMGSRGSLLWGQVSYEITLYRMWITDLLVARRTGLDQFIGINAGGSIHQGAEVGLSWQQPQKPGTYLRLSYTLSDYFFDEFVDGDQDFSGNDLTGQPPHQLGAEMRWDGPASFYAHVRYRFTDAFPIRDDNSLSSSAWQTMDVRIGWQRNLWPVLRLSAYLAVQNIWNESYASMILTNASSFGGAAPRYYYPGLPRNFYGGIRLEYQIQE